MAKKIILIVCFVMIAVFASLVIAGVAIQHDFKADLKKPDFIEIVNKSGRYFSTDDSKIDLDTIFDKFQSKTKTQYLSALLNGTLKSQKPEVKQSAVLTYSGIKKIYMIFKYNESQEIKLENGNTYNYTRIIVEVDKTDSMKRIEMFVLDDAKSEGTTYKYYVTLNQYCDLTNLYNYFDGLIDNFINSSSI